MTRRLSPRELADFPYVVWRPSAEAPMGDLMIRETNHRMLNTLSIINGHLHRDLAHLGPSVRTAVSLCSARIAAFGDVYRMLAVGLESDPVEVAEYVSGLSRALTTAILEPQGLRCSVSVGEGMADPKLCEQLGMIIAELVTNAAKHAFRDRTGGCVRISVDYQDPNWRCTVSDNGCGHPKGRAGGGTRLIAGLLEAMGGTLETASGAQGTSIRVALPGRRSAFDRADIDLTPIAAAGR